MTPTDLSEALTAAEARRVVLAFAEAIWRCDESPDLATLLRDLSQTADLLVGLAYGELGVPKDCRSKLTPPAMQIIAASNESSYAIADRLRAQGITVAPSTVRNARRRMVA